MNIVVTGGTGYVGGFIVRHLLADGHQVRIMSRTSAADRPGNPETYRCALSPDSDFAALLNGADAVVHAAFDHVPGRYRRGEGDDLSGFLRANLAGSMALLSAARHAGVKRAIILSSRAVYGRQMPGVILTETMAVVPDSHYGAVKAALEAFASSLARQEGWPVCALRPTGVCGVTTPAEQSKWYDLVGDLLAGRYVPVRGGTEVHGTDLALAIGHLLSAPDDQIAGECFNCSDVYVSTRDIARAVRDHTGRDIELPSEPSDAAAFNVMDCSKLAALGMTFSGQDMVRKTVKALADHHLQNKQ